MSSNAWRAEESDIAGKISPEPVRSGPEIDFDVLTSRVGVSRAAHPVTHVTYVTLSKKTKQKQMLAEPAEVT